jgi:hypothetical protein
MNPRLETYLRRASSGLPLAQRGMVQAELRGNILLRAAELELLGLTHAQGVARALEEMGAPAHINSGMAWVYTAPKAVRWAFAALLAAWCCVAPLTPATVHVRASAVTNAAGKLTGVNLEPTSFSMAIRAADIALSSTPLEMSQGFGVAHAWNGLIGSDGTWPLRLAQPALTNAHLELSHALRVLCDASARVNLEPSTAEVVFRVTWQGTTARVALTLAPVQVLEFHAGVGRTLEHPCQR